MCVIQYNGVILLFERFPENVQSFLFKILARFFSVISFFGGGGFPYTGYHELVVGENLTLNKTFAIPVWYF